MCMWPEKGVRLPGAGATGGCEGFIILKFYFTMINDVFKFICLQVCIHGVVDEKLLYRQFFHENM